MAAHAGMGRRRGRGDRGCRLRLRRSAGLLEKADLAVIALRARMQRNAKAIERLLQHDLTALGMALVEQLPCRRMPQSLGRSEERRVGKECVSTCRSRWLPDH